MSSPPIHLRADETGIPERLEALAWGFRLRSEEELGWAEDSRCFVGACMAEARALAAHLRAHGFPDAVAASGYYNEVEDGYLDLVDPGDDDLSDWDNRWKHWWVKAAGMVVDTTADQFHPSSPGEHRVTVTHACDPRYGDGSPRPGRSWGMR